MTGDGASERGERGGEAASQTKGSLTQLYYSG